MANGHLDKEILEPEVYHLVDKGLPALNLLQFGNFDVFCFVSLIQKIASQP